ncbi:hypothetical protein [Franconibacter pulveris]|uniref:hypothetical protein n=1 Tax=Franconibacter pulveris TaxID=435910 RepID=UPI000F66EE78|nr:hypothetical protein [Franconibacter pulveris]
MNDNEHVPLQEIHEVIGEAATYLINSHLPVNVDNLVMVLRVQEVMKKSPQHKEVLSVARRYLLQKLTTLS